MTLRRNDTGTHKIGIVGSDITQDELLERGKGWDLWSVNNLYNKWPEVKFSSWFELHEIQKIKGTFYRRMRPNYPIHSPQTVKEYLKAIDELGIPVYMQREWKEVKRSTIFPFEHLMKQYGTYMGCSFAWMVAYAMALGVKELGFFGVPLGGNEYYYQRPSVEHLLGRAIERGIRIYMDETSQLLKANYIYAYKENFDQVYALHGTFTSDLTMQLLTGIQDKINEMYQYSV